MKSPMAELYTKLAQKIVYSSLWGEDPATCKVWITILALKDHSTGILDKNVTGIARIANLPVGVVDAAFNKFLSPDPLSSSEEHEGRRLEKVDGGYLVLNHAKYSEYGWSEEKKEYERSRKARYRTEVPQDGSPAVRRDIFIKPTLAEAKGKAVEVGLPESEGEAFFNYYESNGWKVGKNPMRSWPHALANWKKNWDNRQVGRFQQNGHIPNNNLNASQVGQYEKCGTREWREEQRRIQQELEERKKQKQQPTQQ